jgi:GNAT superfamily N-acetyltransferase
MPKVLIRPARVDDVAAMHDLIVELAVYEKEPDAVKATADDLREVLFGEDKSKAGSPAAYAHVAEYEGRVIGMAIWFLNYSTWLGKHGIYLEDLYVKADYRGLGAGKALLRELARICVERGYGRLEWWVLDWNTPAIDFYLAHDAVAMDDWTVYRVTGSALQQLAE